MPACDKSRAAIWIAYKLVHMRMYELNICRHVRRAVLISNSFFNVCMYIYVYKIHTQLQEEPCLFPTVSLMYVCTYMCTKYIPNCKKRHADFEKLLKFICTCMRTIHTCDMLISKSFWNVYMYMYVHNTYLCVRRDMQVPTELYHAALARVW